MHIKTIGKNKLITLKANPLSIYSIVSYISFLILVAICAFTINHYSSELIKAFAIIFVPLALLIFLFKIIIWNTFGEETILIKPSMIETSLFYNYMYKAQFEQYAHGKFTLKLRSNKTTELLDMETALSKTYKKAKFKLCFQFPKESYYQSAFSISQDELRLLQEVI